MDGGADFADVLELVRAEQGDDCLLYTSMFILVRTSNPSSSQIQELELADGGRVYEHVADLVEDWGKDSIGRFGYSRAGAVVGATHPKDCLLYTSRCV